MIGRTISHYTILEKLGEGGMGVVYKARDTKLDRTVALKFLPGDSSFDPGARDRFLQEARAASALNHPNITTIYEIDEFEKQMFISMEFCEGKTLRQIIRSGRIPLEEAAEIARQVCEGLAAAHEQGIVHRDIKTDNIMLTPKHQVKIMDFGLAKLRGAVALTRTGSTIGTVGFMAPEQIRHENVDQRADIWSFGVVVFEMLTGELPFRGDHEAAIIYSILSEPPKEILELRPDVPPDLERLVARCLEKERAQRYQSAAEILNAIRGPGSSPAGPTAGVRRGGQVPGFLRRPVVLAPAIAVLLALAVLAYRLVDRSEHVRWAEEKAIPQVAQLVDERRLPEAYALAREAESFVGDDSTLSRLMLQCSFRLTVPTTPAGATVMIKPYSAPDSPWTMLGTTPVSSLRLARDPSRLRVIKAGFLSVDAILAPFWDGGSFPAEDTLRLTLDPEGSHPGEMVRVSGGLTSLYLVGLEQESPVILGDYFLDRFEVTNREFKKFVDAGGYENQKYWKVPFRDGGKLLSWSESVGRFHDATGRPGPAKWETGSYRDGRGDYPVSGVSWYEAAAYAEYAGKSLPTIYQWNRAAGTPRSVLIVPLSNFSPKGPAPVGTSNSMGPFGTYDMAGNVKEWVWNEGRGGNRYILGGGWGEPHYMFNDPDAQSPFKRDVTFGFRCARSISGDDDPGRTLGPVDFPARDFTKERPVSGGIFDVYRSLYSYDRTDLRSVVESRDTSAEHWTRERISFAAAYGNERVIAYLFLPRNAPPPYQTVVYFPGSNALHQRSIEFLEVPRIDLIIRSGRAVMYPIYKSTYERGDGLLTDVPDTTVSYRDHVIMWAKDCRRSIDYLQTRGDINTDKLAFLGVSWGAVIGHLITAVDHRFKAAVFIAGGLSVQRSLPEVEQMNFVSRIEAPALMLNGHYDFFFPVETSQIPMFNLLNMPESRKRKVVFESGHSVPRIESAREVLDWLDRYLGPVR